MNDSQTDTGFAAGAAERALTVYEEERTGVRVTYHAGYLSRETADELLAWMSAHAPWQREAPVVFGKAREVRRRTCAFGEPGLTYRYSGVDRGALRWPDPLLEVVDRMAGEFGIRFNFGLCNLYPDGDASIGKHADDERDIVRDSPIVGLSLGATRDFVLYDGDDRRVAAIALEHGSIVIMWGATQRYLKHAVPARRRIREPRINVTFRLLVPEASSVMRQ